MRFPRTLTTAACLIGSLACAAAPDRVLVITADNQVKVWIDEAPRGEVVDWRKPLRIEFAADETPKVIAVEAHNIDGAAGLIGAMMYMAKEPALEQPANWLCSGEEVTGWQQPGFDDSGWQAPPVKAAYGAAPWADTPGLGLKVTSWVWPSDPPGVGETFFCRARIDRRPSP